MQVIYQAEFIIYQLKAGGLVETKKDVIVEIKI